MQRLLIFTLAGFLISGGAGYAQSDQFGAPDTVYIKIVKGPTDGSWIALVDLFNDEPIMAMTIPLRHPADIKIDSVSFVDTRTAYFTYHIGGPRDLPTNSVFLGYIAAVGDGKPPLEKGTGTIGKIHFSAPKELKVEASLFDSTRIPPSNILQLVTPDAKSIRPVFVNGAVAVIKPDVKTETPPKEAGKKKKK